MGFKMDAPDPNLVPVGTHLVEVVECKEKRSKKSGALMWEVALRATSFPQETIDEWWMLEGKMAWQLRKRLALMGFAADANVEAYEIIGKRFYAAIVHAPNLNGDTVARIDGRAEDSTVGMWPEDAPPPNVDEALSQGSDLFGQTPPPKAKEPEPGEPGYAPF